MAGTGGLTGNRRRRRIDAVVLVVLLGLVALATLLATRVASGERVARLWVGAVVAADGSARVVEVVDYDFGANDRHGIYRSIPDLREEDPVEVSSPTAPDEFELRTTYGAYLQIGDPFETVSGQHRYVVEYTLEDVVSPEGELAWDAVGSDWDVPIVEAEVHVVAATELTDGVCVAGRYASTDPCPLREEAPGHLVAEAADLDVGEGVTVSAVPGAALTGAAALPGAPAVVEPDGTGVLAPAALFTGIVLLCGLVVAWLLRRAGREHVPTVGIPSLAGPGEQARIDLDELAAHAGPSSALPEGLGPAQGGVLRDGYVFGRHQAAWLVEAAVDGDLDIRPGTTERTSVLVRLRDDGPRAPLLDLAFRGRRRLTLGTYDQDFAAFWKALARDLRTWRRTSGLVDVRAERRARWTRWTASLAGLAGIGITWWGAAVAAHAADRGLLLTAVGGVLAGVGLSTAVRGWELRVLTPQGATAWLRTESLRLFLASGSGTAVDEVGDELGRYTAWAVALGVSDRWKQLASLVGARTGAGPDVLHLTTLGPTFVSGCSAASTAPSSSGGGSGGGSVGGGSGGGGGGSW
ncbi:DUF2207 domain-containing protein [Blastococcus sp. SYSU D00669]